MIERNQEIVRGAHIVTDDGIMGNIMDIFWDDQMQQVKGIEVLLETGASKIYDNTAHIFRIGKWVIGNKVELGELKKRHAELNKEIMQTKQVLRELQNRVIALYAENAQLRKQIFRHENNMIHNWKEKFTK